MTFPPPRCEFCGDDITNDAYVRLLDVTTEWFHLGCYVLVLDLDAAFRESV